MPSLAMHTASKTRAKKKSSKKSQTTKKQQKSGKRQYLSSPPNHNHFEGVKPLKQYSNQLTTLPEFIGNRSPFHETMSRHCVMPICARQLINFQFNLPAEYVQDIRRSLRTKHKASASSKPKDTSPHRLLHIRLFDLAETRHVDWDPDLLHLKINRKDVRIPPLLSSKSKSKSKAAHKANTVDPLRLVQPLDISKHAEHTMSFEIACHKSVFYGGMYSLTHSDLVSNFQIQTNPCFVNSDLTAASIEIVNLLSVDQIAARVIQRSDLASKLHALAQTQSQSQTGTKSAQKCKICGCGDNLSRCSRCKATWYCSRAHQQEDWAEHHLGCQPFDELSRLKLPSSSAAAGQLADAEGDDIVCREIAVSIRDPLSLCRIAIPVRGTGCRHPQCVDLRTFLDYCHHTKSWQCPICMQPLRYKALVVDQGMLRIIGEVAPDIDQVRLNPDDYSYKVVTLDDQRLSDGMLKAETGAASSSGTPCSQSVNGKKRKFGEIELSSSDDEDVDHKKAKATGTERKRTKTNRHADVTGSRPKQVDVIVLD